MDFNSWFNRRFSNFNRDNLSRSQLSDLLREAYEAGAEDTLISYTRKVKEYRTQDMEDKPIWQGYEGKGW